MNSKNIATILLIVCFTLFASVNLVFGVGLCEYCCPASSDPACSSSISCDSGFNCVNNKCEKIGSVSFCSPIPSQDFEDVIAGIIDMLFTLAVVVAPVMVLIGAFMFMSSAGDAKKLKQGREIILYTVIGFVIILLVKGVVSLVETLVGA